jgi:hypothetical protein
MQAAALVDRRKGRLQIKVRRRCFRSILSGVVSAGFAVCGAGIGMDTFYTPSCCISLQAQRIDCQRLFRIFSETMQELSPIRGYCRLPDGWIQKVATLGEEIGSHVE